LQEKYPSIFLKVNFFQFRKTCDFKKIRQLQLLGKYLFAERTAGATGTRGIG